MNSKGSYLEVQKTLKKWSPAGTCVTWEWKHFHEDRLTWWVPSDARPEPSKQLLWVSLNSKAKSQNSTHFQSHPKTHKYYESFVPTHWLASSLKSHFLYSHCGHARDSSTSSRALFFLGFQISYFLTRLLSLLLMLLFSTLIFVLMFNLNLSPTYLYSWPVMIGAQKKRISVSKVLFSACMLLRGDRVINPLMGPCMNGLLKGSI